MATCRSELSILVSSDFEFVSNCLGSEMCRCSRDQRLHLVCTANANEKAMRLVKKERKVSGTCRWYGMLGAL